MVLKEAGPSPASPQRAEQDSHPPTLMLGCWAISLFFLHRAVWIRDVVAVVGVGLLQKNEVTSEGRVQDPSVVWVPIGVFQLTGTLWSVGCLRARMSARGLITYLKVPQCQTEQMVCGGFWQRPTLVRNMCFLGNRCF